MSGHSPGPSWSQHSQRDPLPCLPLGSQRSALGPGQHSPPPTLMSWHPGLQAPRTPPPGGRLWRGEERAAVRLDSRPGQEREGEAEREKESHRQKPKGPERPPEQVLERDRGRGDVSTDCARPLTPASREPPVRVAAGSQVSKGCPCPGHREGVLGLGHPGAPVTTAICSWSGLLPPLGAHHSSHRMKLPEPGEMEAGTLEWEEPGAWCSLNCL